jgi:hypothetical protein
MIRSGPGRFLLLVSAVGLLWSCTPHFRWKAMEGEMENLRTSRRVHSLPSPYRDFAGTIHVHTTLSHDSEGLLDEIVEASRKAGSAFVITTDHHQPKVYQRGFEGWFGDILVIRGSEIIKGCKGTTGAGCNSLLVLGVNEYINKRGLTMPEVVARVKELGGIAIAAHPHGYVDWGAPIDGMEIYDILDDAVDKKWKYPKWVFDVLYSFDRYREVVFLSILDTPRKGLKKWDELTPQRRIVAIAGNDAHQNIRYFGKQIDPYDLTLRFVRTHVLAPELNENEILGALTAGHAYVAFDILADATGFGFWAETESPVAIMGDEVPMGTGLQLRIQTPVFGRITLVHNGRTVAEADTDHLTIPVDSPGVYRVEVQLRIGNRWRPWIYSNPIYVRSTGDS